MGPTRTASRTVAAAAALVALFAAGCFVAYAIAGGAVRYVPLATGPKASKAALRAAKSHCTTLRHRVGVASFVKTFKTLNGCRNILAPTAQTGIATCRKRYPAGSTAYRICLQVAFESSSAEKAAMAGLRIV